MEYVTPEYEQQLNELADTLVTPERYLMPDIAESLGQLALFDIVEKP